MACQLLCPEEGNACFRGEETAEFRSGFGPTPNRKTDEKGRKDTKIHEKDTHEKRRDFVLKL